MSVVGAYVAWIDISLIANDRFISLLLKFMTIPELREGSCDCVHDIISKGMDGVTKTQLVESLMEILENSRVFAMATEENDPEFLAKLSKLLNGIGTALVDSFNKLVKGGDEARAKVALKAVQSKFPRLLEFLNNDDDGVSEEIIQFASQYVGVLKHCHKDANWTDEDRNNLKPLLLVVINKMKYEDTYKFLSEGEDEVVFIEYRKQLKTIFDNIASLDQVLVLHTSEYLLLSILANLQTESFVNIEVALRIFYMLGEVIHDKAGHFTGADSTKSPWYRMMTAILQSGISEHEHIAVCQQYFELVVRYDKFFLSETSWIPHVLSAFLGRNGLRHREPHIRSRCCYYFCRFIKSMRSVIADLSDDILYQLQELMSYECLEQNYLSSSDQNFLYEAAGYIVVYSGKSAEQKGSLLHQILSLALDKFKLLLPKLVELTHQPETQELCAQRLHDLLSCASRCTKVFPNHQMTHQNGCVPCLAEGLTVILQGLDVPVHRDLLHSGVRQYLHRMIICLGDELLRHIPMAVHMMLKDCTVRVCVSLSACLYFN
jgi:exportin-T